MSVEAVPSVSGWRAGAGNVFRHESRLWWRSNRWWIQAVFSTAILNRILVGMLWVASEANQGNLQLEEPAMGAADVFPQFVGLALLLSTIGVVVLTQGAILDERRAGTLEWVLAKPVTRTGIVIAKSLAHVLPVLAVFLVLPWAVVNLQLSWEVDEAWPVREFMVVVSLIARVPTFTVALVIMLGTWTTSRALVVGLSIGGAIL